MARRRKAKNHALKSLTLSDIRLVDFRIKSIRCERFIPPESISKGAYKLTLETRMGSPEPEQGELGDLFLTLGGKLEGTKVENEVSKEGPKSFSIDAVCEGWFKGPDGVVKEAQVSPQLSKDIVSLVTPLMVTRLRAYATDMGFRGVRPSLGFNTANASISDLRREQPKLERPKAAAKARAFEG